MNYAYQLAVHCMLNADIIKTEKPNNWLISLLIHVGAPFTFSFDFFTAFVVKRCNG